MNLSKLTVSMYRLVSDSTSIPYLLGCLAIVCVSPFNGTWLSKYLVMCEDAMIRIEKKNEKLVAILSTNIRT